MQSNKSIRFISIYLALIAGLTVFALLALLVREQLQRQIQPPVAALRNVADQLPVLTGLGFGTGVKAVETADPNGYILPDTAFDTGFETTFDGFGFRNYGSRSPEGDLSVQKVWSVFGDDVCAQVAGGECVPLPITQLWLDQMNDAMASGHCVGFTVFSHRLAMGETDPSVYASNAANTFALSRDVSVMQQIALDWTLQTTGEIIDATVRGTPRDIVDGLLNNEAPVDLGLFNRKGGGHSVSAYGAEPQGNGIYHIKVYDNNWPGQELYVEVDYVANTWRYSLAAADPASDPEAWEGDDRTRSLMYVPLDAYTQNFECPFCDDVVSAARPATGGVLASPASTNSLRGLTMLYFSDDDGYMRVETDAGQRVGNFSGSTLNEVAGARIVPLRGSMFNNGEPLIFMPPETEMTITVETREEEAIGTGNLRAIGNGIALSLDRLNFAPASTETFDLDLAKNRLEFSPTSAQEQMVLKVSVQQPDGSAIVAVVGGVQLDAAETLAFGLEPDGDLLVETDTAQSQDEMWLILANVSETATDVFASDDLSLAAGGAVRLAVSDWTPTEGLAVAVGVTGSDTFAAPIQLPNAPVGDVLDDFNTANQVISAFGEIDDYMDATDQADFLETLVDALDNPMIDGSDYGEVLFALDAFALETTEMAAFVNELGLPPSEIAELILELNLSEAAFAAVIADLNLTEAQRERLAIEMDLFIEVDNFLDELEFNTIDEEDAIDVLFASDLTPDQIGDAIDELDLEIPEIIETLLEFGYTYEEARAALIAAEIPEGERNAILQELFDVTPTPTFTVPATTTPTQTATSTPTQTAASTATPTQATIATSTQLATATAQPTFTPTKGVVVIAAMPTLTPEPTATILPTETLAPTSAPAPTVASVPTATPTQVNEIDVQGGGISITNGDTTPDVADDTDFGDVAFGGTVTKTFTINNTGTADLNIAGLMMREVIVASAGNFVPRLVPVPSPITITGPGASQFGVIAPGPASPVPAGGSTTFQIIFIAGGRGSVHNATVSIANDDADESPFTFAIQGTTLP